MFDGGVANMPSEDIIITFGPGTSRITDAGKARLDEVALQMKENPSLTAVVTGYSEQGPLRLAYERANNVRNYILLQHSIDPERVKTEEQEGGDVGAIVKL